MPNKKETKYTKKQEISRPKNILKVTPIINRSDIFNKIGIIIYKDPICYAKKMDY